MQYFVSVIDDQSNSGTDEEMAAIDAFNADVQARGQWVFAAGLASPDTATTVDNRAGRALVVDGPFVETKEWVAGFWVFEAPDLDAALELAAAGSLACNRRVEVRAFLPEPS
ncbi:hypothetical protein G5V58_14745 [Nocardioides anomalus]|uniref:YCII-related domain-containing protein n=1 Tax=Nocardioides anomalus TaxID=2712223 RepID=A0A6G6WFN8_9ACTN|nr:YciI family protein [Nocardioides anomalus]QIG43860.1 hypothetical protein G5V58_14745 [Nocardioides anomalus]